MRHGSIGNNNYFEVDSSSNTIFGTSNAERMRITATGAVGIGTSSPSDKLHVVGNSFLNGNILTSTNSTFYNSTGDLFIRAGTSGALRMGSNGSNDRVIIGSNGEVGIGGQLAGSLLHVQGNTGGTIISVGDSAQTEPLLFMYSDATSNTGEVRTRNNFPLVFGTNNTERMRLDTSGNLAIGLTSPTSKLHVAGAAAFQATTTYGNFYMRDVSTTGQELHIRSSAGKGAYISFTENAISDNWAIGYDAGVNSLLFRSGGTTGTERMRLTSAGALLVGTTSPSRAAQIVSQTTSTTTYCVGGYTSSTSYTGNVFDSFVGNTTSLTSQTLYSGANGNGACFQVLGNGNVTNSNGSYGTISDIKNKENIVDATPKLDKINQLKVRNFNFIGNDLKQIGFIAQEFEQVFPSIVEEIADRTHDGELLETTTKSIKMSVLVPILVKAIQELKTELDSVKAELQTLKGS
jgi:hypothetical protein